MLCARVCACACAKCDVVLCVCVCACAHAHVYYAYVDMESPWTDDNQLCYWNQLMVFSFDDHYYGKPQKCCYNDTEP